MHLTATPIGTHTGNWSIQPHKDECRQLGVSRPLPWPLRRDRAYPEDLPADGEGIGTLGKERRQRGLVLIDGPCNGLGVTAELPQREPPPDTRVAQT